MKKTSRHERRQARRVVGADLSLLYEFNWPMSETEILQRSMKFSNIEDLRSLLADLKKAGLTSDPVPGIGN